MKNVTALIFSVSTIADIFPISTPNFTDKEGIENDLLSKCKWTLFHLQVRRKIYMQLILNVTLARCYDLDDNFY